MGQRVDEEYVTLDPYHDREELPYVLVKRNGRFLDVGASTGPYSGQALEYCDFVLALEPYSKPFSLLYESSQDNPRIVCLRLAVSNYDGIARLYDGGPTMTPSLGQEPLETIHSTTLNLIWKAYGPFDTVKIDIEGEEERALLGASTLLEAGVLFCIEVHEEKHPDPICRFLEEHGYAIEMKGYRTVGRPLRPHYIVARKVNRS